MCRASLPNRTLRSDGNVLYPCCAEQEPPATSSHRTLEMWPV